MAENKSVKTKICFVICPVGSPKDDVRKRSDDLLNHIISPVMSEFGLETIRADKLGIAGDIPTQIIVKLDEADLVVADLTDNNPNVFYELAIRHALRKPIIHMIKSGRVAEIPFDLRQYRAIEYDTLDYNMLDPARDELRKQASEQLKNPQDIVNPFTLALRRAEVDRKGSPDEKMIAVISDQIRLISNRLERLEGDRSRRGYVEYRIQLNRDIDSLRAELASSSKNIEELSYNLNRLRAELSSSKGARNDKDLHMKIATLRESLQSEIARRNEILSKLREIES